METERTQEAMPVVKPDATYEDLIGLPDNLVAELVDGRLHASPRPSMRHALAGSALGNVLGNAFHEGVGGPGGWWVLAEPELHLGQDVVVPDLAGWRRERLPEIPDAPWTSVAPDWVCEVASPSTERLDRVDKLPIYARAGVTHAWVVNPITRMIEIYRREGPRWTLVGAHGGDAKLRVEPFDAIEWELSRLWGGSTEP